MTSPRYSDVEEAWSRFLGGQAREALRFLSDVAATPAHGHAFDRRLAAIEALAGIGESLCEPDRMRLAPAPTESAALAEIAVPALAGALADRDGRIRHRACAALRRIGPPAIGAVAALERLRQDADPLLRQLAGRALAVIQARSHRDA